MLTFRRPRGLALFARIMIMIRICASADHRNPSMTQNEKTPGEAVDWMEERPGELGSRFDGRVIYESETNSGVNGHGRGRRTRLEKLSIECYTKKTRVAMKT